MAPNLKGLVARFRRRDNHANSFSTAPEGQLFQQTNPEVDGDECLHDCDTCTINLPRTFKIDESDQLYGFIKGWSTHLVVATGKTDWVRDVEDEKGSIMEAVGKSAVQPSNGRLMLSASNMPVPDEQSTPEDATTVLLLPAFTYIDNVTPASVPDLIKTYIDNAPTNTTPLQPTSSLPTKPTDSVKLSPSASPSSGLTPRQCPHNYLILLCSQKTRDARCGQSAPLLKRELERHLRPLGLYRDLLDERPGGVGIYFISHVGGHKYSANMMIYRRAGMPGTGVSAVSTAFDESLKDKEADVIDEDAKDNQEQVDTTAQNGSAGLTHAASNGWMPSPQPEDVGEAAQCIWLARVRPEDCENIIRYTVLQGKVVKPDRQLRGGFDRGKCLVSW